jgi:AcrR family transcriptional regulator
MAVKQNPDEERGAPGEGRGVPRRRAVQAEQTRAEILQSARRHFSENGYAASSLKAIAADAGVSVQTVYDSVGSKSDLVRRLNDLIDAEADVLEIVGELATEEEPERVAAIAARITRRIVERCGDIVRASYDAARAEPELGAVVEEGGRRHRAGAQFVAARLAELGALPEAIDEADVARTIAILSDARLALVMLADHGLDFDGVEMWMSETTCRAVLGRAG